MKIALIGFGVVGQGLVEILRDKHAMLAEQYGFSPSIVAVATRSRGTLYHPDGLELDTLLNAVASGSLSAYPDFPQIIRDWSVMQIIENSNADVIVELAHSNLETGQPAIEFVMAAFKSGKHVVLANKGPVALAYPQLKALAAQYHVQLRYEATVMAGTPSIHLVESALRGCTIHKAQGILNGTTNYILTRMEQGLEYEAALQEAQALGYAEADPTADVGGWDAAGKLLILANVLYNKPLRFSDLSVQGITNITRVDVETALAAGERWKLIAEVTPTGGSVQPMRIPSGSPLAGVSGSNNALMVQTDLLGEVTLIGAGAGKHVTGFGVLSDLLSIHKP